MSTTWKLFSGRKSPDFYIVPMMCGGALKVSLHASGSWQVGITKEHQESNEALEARHWEIWKRGPEMAPGIVRGWYLLIPERELGKGDQDPKAMQLPPVGGDGAVSLEVLMMHNEGPTPVFEHSFIVGRWPLSQTNESCVVVARRIPWSSEHEQWADQARAEAVNQASTAGIQPDSAHRYFFHGHDTTGVRFGMELAPRDAML